MEWMKMTQQSSFICQQDESAKFCNLPEYSTPLF